MIFAFAGCADSVTNTDKTDPVTNTDKTDSDYTLPAPANVKAAVSTKTVCAVTVTWDAINCDKVHWYWIYCSTKNDTSSLKEPNGETYSYLINDGIGSYDVILPESGTYYFWVKAAPSSYSTSTASSAFSEVSNSVSFTHDLPVPTNLQVYRGAEGNAIFLRWTSTKAPYYHIYSNTENNSETATLYTSNWDSESIIIYDSWLTTGTTYYFWVKSADTSSIDSPTSGFSNVASLTWSE